MNTEDFGALPALRTHLAALAEREQPASAVDVAAARRAGGRIRRRNLARRLAAVAVAAAVSVLTCTTLLSAVHKSGDTALAPSPAPLNAQMQSYPLAAGTDPVDISGSFGWLPQGFTMLPMLNVSAGQFAITAQGVPTAVNADVTHQPYITFSVNTYNYVSIWMDDVQQLTDETVKDRPATLTLGQTAEASCVTSKVVEPPEAQQPKDPVGELTWSLADGRRASLKSCLPLGTSQPDAKATLLHIAQTVTITDRPTAMPFYVKVGNIPSPIRLELWQGPAEPPTGDDWLFGMTFGQDSMDPSFSLRVTPADSTYATSEPRMPACRVAHGLQVCVGSGSFFGKTPSGSAAGLGYQGLLDDIVVLGANPATWTTDVFR